MRVLILGGTGTLGAQLAARWRAAGHGVAATGRELDATAVDMLTEYARRHDVVRPVRSEHCLFRGCSRN